MHFSTNVVALLAAASSALALTINSPSPSSYWVQNTSNTISWSYNAGSDPNPVNIIVSNSNSSFLNGNFSIASGVDLSNGTFTVTNVTLRVAVGYTVSFVNTSNQDQVYASSQQFEVKAPGTAPASIASPSASATGSASTGSSSATSTSDSSSSSSDSAALRTIGVDFAVLPVFVSAGMVLAGGLLAL